MAGAYSQLVRQNSTPVLFAQQEHGCRTLRGGAVGMSPMGMCASSMPSGANRRPPWARMVALWPD